jgi:hypothetical protein
MVLPNKPGSHPFRRVLVVVVNIRKLTSSVLMVKTSVVSVKKNLLRC